MQVILAPSTTGAPLILFENKDYEMSDVFDREIGVNQGHYWASCQKLDVSLQIYVIKAFTMAI